MREERLSNAPEGVYVSVDNLLSLRHLAKDISLQTNKKSIALLDGSSRSSFRGRGMEFAEVRPYQAGDDIRNIDWRVTARTQKPYTKLFQEERERPVYLVVDQRSPMFFGSKKQFKSVFAAKLATVLAWAAMQNNDRIGALIFSDQDQTDSRARRGKHAALSLIHELVDFNHQLATPNATSKNTMAEMLQDIRRVAKPGSAVFILSDFHDFSDDCAEPLAVLARHCSVTAMHIYDPLEKQLPSQHFLTITDGKQRLNIAGQTKDFSQRYENNFSSLLTQLKQVLNQYGVNFASLSVEESLTGIVKDLFHTRGAKTRAVR